MHEECRERDDRHARRVASHSALDEFARGAEEVRGKRERRMARSSSISRHFRQLCAIVIKRREEYTRGKRILRGRNQRRSSRSHRHSARSRSRFVAARVRAVARVTYGREETPSRHRSAFRYRKKNCNLSPKKNKKIKKRERYGGTVRAYVSIHRYTKRDVTGSTREGPMRPAAEKTRRFRRDTLSRFAEMNARIALVPRLSFFLRVKKKGKKERNKSRQISPAAGFCLRCALASRQPRIDLQSTL